MHLTAFSDYTLRVLTYLALDQSKLATVPAIAAAYGISENHLMKVVHQLARQGIVQSVRGKGGGIRLATPPDQLRLGAILRASAGTAPIVECLGEQRERCCIAPSCRLSGVLVRAFESLYATLDEYTLADLVAEPGALKSTLGLTRG